MTGDFERIAELFESARQLAPDERAAHLDAACDGDRYLRREVEELLAHEAGDDALSDRALDSVRRRLSRVAEESGAAAESIAMPERIGEFSVVRRLGAGGMGVVFEALQDRPRRSVAIKLLRPSLLVAGVLRRFEREAEILGRLRHPGIAQVYETGTCDLGDGPQPYFAMELVEGRPLERYAREEELDVRRRLELVIGICEAVHHAHTRGIVHRDLKPDNVLVDGAGRPRVLDFGVAHAVAADDAAATLQTSEGEFVGTLDYMAPEQVLGGDAARTPAIDVYALGALLYELLSGRTPHELGGRSLVAAARMVAEVEPVPLRRVAPQVSVDVGWVVDAALAADVSRRYDSALALADELRRVLAGEPVRARPPSALYRLERLVSRNRLAAAGIGIAFVSLVVGLVISVTQSIEARASEAESKRQAKKSAAINEYLLDRMLSSFSPLGMGRDVKVVDVLDVAAPAIDEVFADEPETAAGVRLTLGRSYYQLGLWDESSELLLRAHSGLTEILGPKHPDTIEAATAAIRALLSLEQLDEATALCAPALTAARERGGESAADVLALRSLDAQARFATGERDAALADARAALADAERSHGLDDVTLELRYALAQMTSETGDLAEAEALTRTYLDEVRALHAPGNPREVMAMTQLTWIRMERGDDAGALVLAERALERAKAQFGDDHPTTLFALSTLGSVLTEVDDYARAKTVHEDCLAAYERVLGDRSRATLRVLGNLAILSRRMGELDTALDLARDVLALRREVLGDDDPDVAQAYDVLAAIHIEREEYDEADAALERGLEIARAFFGGATPEVADILYNRATLRSRQGELAEAERLYRELHETELAIYGPDHPYPVMDRYQVARMITRQGRHADAASELQGVLADQRRLLAADDVAILNTLATLGECLLRSGRAADAEAPLREAIEGFEARDDEQALLDSRARANLEEVVRIGGG